MTQIKPLDTFDTEYLHCFFNRISYKKQLGENFAINTNAGGSNRFIRFRSESLNTDGLAIPNFYNVANSEQPLQGSNRLSQEQINSVFGTVDFDIFGAAFYLISRYEEYLPHTKDNHHRYLAYQSLAYQQHFLELPLVNIWAVELKKVIETQISIEIPLKNKFKIILQAFQINLIFGYVHSKTALSHVSTIII